MGAGGVGQQDTKCRRCQDKGVHVGAHVGAQTQDGLGVPIGLWGMHGHKRRLKGEKD